MQSAVKARGTLRRRNREIVAEYMVIAPCRMRGKPVSTIGPAIIAWQILPFLNSQRPQFVVLVSAQGDPVYPGLPTMQPFLVAANADWHIGSLARSPAIYRRGDALRAPARFLRGQDGEAFRAVPAARRDRGHWRVRRGG